MTIIIRVAMSPMNFRMQRTSMKMRKIQPLMAKVREKYGNTTDPELKRKMNLEISELYKKHKVGIITSCLPLLLTMPIFIGLNLALRQSYIYVDFFYQSYEQIARALIRLPEYWHHEVLNPIIIPLLRPEMFRAGIDTRIVETMVMCLRALNPYEWAEIISQLPASTQSYVSELYNNKVAAQTFLGLDMVANPGFAFPAIIIPILSGGTMFLSSWVSQKLGATTMSNDDPNSKMMMRMMLIVMPIMMIWITTTISGGVGVFWIMSNILQIVQQYFVYKYYSDEDRKRKVLGDELYKL
jgi:YidC/Oxa1 family membrane protein insertase